MVFAQSESSATWQPDFNEDRLLSMPDLLPLLGHFGSQWGSTLEDNEAPKPNVVELNWSGQESEALKLPFDADMVILTPGVNDLSDPDQRSVSIRHILVESYVINEGYREHNASARCNAHEATSVVFESGHGPLRCTDAARDPVHIAHARWKQRRSLDQQHGLSERFRKTLRTMASLVHAGGQVYFAQ